MRNSKWMRLLALLAGLALIAAACGDDDDEATDDTAADDTATDDGGDGEEALVIGALLPESGALSSIIGALRTPIDLAVEDINAAGGVLGSDVSIAAADDATDDATQAQAGFDRLVNSEGVQVLLGPASSTLTEGLMDAIANNDVIACSGSNTAASLEDLEDNGHYFGFAPNDNLQGPALAEVVASDGHENVAILARNDTYGVGFAEAVAGALEDAGINIVHNETYDPEATSGYQSDVEALAATDPDAAVIIGFNDDGAAIVSQMIEVRHLHG